MAFSSSVSPDDGLDAGDRVSGRPDTVGSPGGAPRGGLGDGEDAEDKRVLSVSVELSEGVGRRLVVKCVSVEIGQDWATSVNVRKKMRSVHWLFCCYIWKNTDI